MSANSPETVGRSDETAADASIVPSEISPQSGDSIVDAIVWAWRAPAYYRRRSSETMHRIGERFGRPFDDTNGEYVPIPAQREEAEQEIWQYAMNQAGVSVEDMYKLQERAGQIVEAIDLAQERE
jgi:Mlc titration factor MtfA (ptsG expression regulator)